MPEQLSERKAIWVYIRLDGEGFAISPEFDLRYALEDAVAEREIGKLQGVGSGGGWMDFSFEVENINAVEPALWAVKNLLAEYKVPDEIVRLTVGNQYDVICDDLPDFQPGDCLSYRFEDGDFGAALVLKLWNDELNSNETLLGILDYKLPNSPPPVIFERRKWLMSTHESRRGQPHLRWVHCFGGIEVEVVHRISLKNDDPMACRFHLSWELVPEYFIRDKYRGNKELNPYETIRENLPDFQPGDCLSYRYEDGDFGAALVLKRSNDGLHSDETLLGILDHKDQTQPQLSVFERRNWLIAAHEWHRGQPFLVWAHYCDGIEVEIVGHIALKDDDPMACLFSLCWEDIPGYVAREKI